MKHKNLQHPPLGGDKPRERLNTRGLRSSSDRDLLSVYLGYGTQRQPVESLAATVLERLDSLGAAPCPEDLEGIPGLGHIRRMQICAGMELFRRIHLPKRHRIASSSDLLPVLDRWADREQEHFFSLTLNGANELLQCTVVSIGTVNRTLVHPREVFAPAIQDRAAALIIAHNHPSGSLEPSREDLAITKRLREAGELLGIPLLDHVIFSGSGHISFLDKGLW